MVNLVLVTGSSFNSHAFDLKFFSVQIFIKYIYYTTNNNFFIVMTMHTHVFFFLKTYW